MSEGGNGMSLLLPILLGLVVFFITKYISAVGTITAIVISGISVIVFVGIWQGTLYCLKKLGYYTPNKRQTYRHVDSNLQQIVRDLQEIRFELQETEPYLRGIEFIKYAPQNTEVKESET